MTNPNGVLFTFNAVKDDWLLAVDFDDPGFEPVPYSLEDLTAEVVAQLAWRLRLKGRPAIVTADALVLPSNDIIEGIDMEGARWASPFHSQRSFRVDCNGAHLLLPGRLPQMRLAAANLPVMYSVIYPDFPHTSMVMSLVEYSEGITLRASGSLSAIFERIARDLDLVVRNTKLTAVEPASFLNLIEEKGRGLLALLDQQKNQ